MVFQCIYNFLWHFTWRPMQKKAFLLVTERGVKNEICLDTQKLDLKNEVQQCCFKQCFLSRIGTSKHLSFRGLALQKHLSFWGLAHQSIFPFEVWHFKVFFMVRIDTSKHASFRGLALQSMPLLEDWHFNLSFLLRIGTS